MVKTAASRSNHKYSTLDKESHNATFAEVVAFFNAQYKNKGLHPGSSFLFEANVPKDNLTQFLEHTSSKKRHIVQKAYNKEGKLLPNHVAVFIQIKSD